MAETERHVALDAHGAFERDQILQLGFERAHALGSALAAGWRSARTSRTAPTSAIGIDKAMPMKDPRGFRCCPAREKFAKAARGRVADAEQSESSPGLRKPAWRTAIHSSANSITPSVKAS
jgi:hypothetical protein